MTFLIMAYWHDPHFKKKPGGLIRMFELADNLLELGHDVTMVLPKLGFPKTQTRAKVVAIPFFDAPLLRPFCFHVLSTLYLAFACLRGVDRLYVRQMNSFLPFLLSRTWRIFSYFEIPNDPYLGYSFIDPGKRLLVKGIDRLCTVLADRNVVLSEWSKNRLHAFGGIPLEKILVFPSGTDTNLFQPRDKEEACQELGLDPSFYYVGFIGSFLEYQGIDTLIDAAPLILEEVPSTRFLLVGDGPMKDTWESRARGKGLENHFVFTGHVPYRQVPVYLGAMDVCVAPHHEDTNQASPVKLFDYMAAGRPIIASDLAVVQEIIQNSGCAMLIKPNNEKELSKAILAIILDPIKRKQMSHKGREFAVIHYDRKHLTKSLFQSDFHR